MPFGDLETEIQAVEGRLVSLTRRIEEFEVDSRSRIAAKHQTMLGELRNSVDAVNRTMLFLHQGEDSYMDSVIGAVSEAQATKDIVRKHSAGMHESFLQLRKTATLAAKQAEDVKCQFSEFDVQLDVLRNDLDAVATLAELLFTIATSSLAEKEREVGKAKQTLLDKKEGIGYLEGQLDGDRDERHRLRKKRAKAWAASIIFPPVAIRAICLELIASDVRAQIRELKDQISCEESNILSLEREKITLETQKQALATVVANTKALIARCEPLTSSASETQTLVDSRIIEYHDLVLKTDDFASWTGDLSRQTNAFRLLGSSTRLQLQTSTAKIITRLLEMDQAEVKLITADLRRV
ncbi:hypothetical protein F5Y18DRAFT_250048 [Xylariaceae sp. FL1019]|nr:hypothetical protein F5Y18DRAFT_250048 [Xylariaceae sp. FL1019]